MSKKESRRDRRNQENQANRSTSRDGISKVYYIVIGVLFLILIGLVIFIFSRTGDDVQLNEEATSPSQVEDVTDSEIPEENELEAEEDPVEENTSDPHTDNPDEDNEEDEEELVEEDELEEGESEVVTEDAPYDSSHATDFTSGSSDRVAIKNQIIQATGLDSSLTEWWVGNDGPGRVKATVSNNSQTEYYDVYLQYGDGSWHVTSYQRVSGNE